MTLEPGEKRDIVMLLGAADSEEAVREIIGRHRAPAAAGQSVTSNIDAWEKRLATIRVRTPEPTFDLMVNRWSLYQALSCRMWARSALYQSSGAFGFRDQLQDVMAFVYSEPAIARDHIVTAASRQFVEGDVQHWWHPQTGRGVRTRFSDDLVWLPYVIDHYVTVTADREVFDDRSPVSHDAAPQSGRTRDLRSTETIRGSRNHLRSLRSRAEESVHQGRARASAHRQRRLERWNEPGWDRGEGRECVAGVVSHNDAAEVLSARRESVATTRCATKCLARPMNTPKPSSAPPGTANGIGVPTSTTDLRWAHGRVTSARSIRSRKAGA